MKMRLVRTLAGYAPADAESEEFARKRHKPGQVVTADVVVPRNHKFHRKFFALLNLGFQYWEPDATHKGRPVLKDFERFRSDVIILAGFYDVVVNLNGELRLEPKSIAWHKMEDDEFERLYQASIQVLLDKVLGAKGFDRAEIDRVVDELLRFT